MDSKQDLQQIKHSFINSHSKIQLHTKLLENASTSDKLQPHQDELQQLSELAGIHMNSKEKCQHMSVILKMCYRILVELLNMGVGPNTIFSVLKSIRRTSGRHTRSSFSQISHS